MRSRISLLWIPAGLFILSCSQPKVDLTVDDLQDRFNNGSKYLKKKKYYKAQQEFEYVLLRGKHTELGDDAQFYLAESYFLNEEYVLAISEYERLARQMTYSPYVEKSRFRICESYAKKSPKYYHDQNYTDKAIEKLQEFIEDFPESEYTLKAVESIGALRSKLAEKLYESAVLYIKMEEYNSAVRYLEDLLSTYYDTPYADMARLRTVEAYLKAGDIVKAEDFLNRNRSKFEDEHLLEEATSLLSVAKNKRDQSKGS